MADILDLAIPYFSVIFSGFACGKTKRLPEARLAWMNFFLLYVSPPALMFGILARTPFSELNNPPFLIATTLGTVIAFIVAMITGRIIFELGPRNQLTRIDAQSLCKSPERRAGVGRGNLQSARSPAGAAFLSRPCCRATREPLNAAPLSS